MFHVSPQNPRETVLSSVTYVESCFLGMVIIPAMSPVFWVTIKFNSHPIRRRLAAIFYVSIIFWATLNTLVLLSF